MGLEMWVQAFVGGLIGLLLMPIGNTINNILQMRKNPDISGKWISTWEIKDGDKKWATEELVIIKYFGRYKIISKDNDCSYLYTGIFNFSLNNTLIGELHSVKKGATTEGASILYISNQGNFLYGTSFSPNTLGTPVIRKWAIGKTEKDIKFAKELLL